MKDTVILSRLFLRKYNERAVNYKTYWKEIEKYTAIQQTKLTVSSIILIICNFNMLAVGIAHIIFTCLDVLAAGAFLCFLFGFLNDLIYFKSDKRRAKYRDTLVSPEIIVLCRKLDKLPKYYYSGLFFEPYRVY